MPDDYKSIEEKTEELKHYGTPRHSGRYPWGSGDTPYQRNCNFLGYVHKLKAQGVKETAIAKGMGMKTTELRKKISVASDEQKAYESTEATRLKDKGYSISAIGRAMQKNESSVRLLLNPVLKVRRTLTSNTADILREEVEKKSYIDVGAGTEEHMGVSKQRLNTAVAMLQREGYTVHQIPVEQLGTGKKTNIKVLALPGTEWKTVARNKDKIKMVVDYYSEDGGDTISKIEPPRSISSKRIMVRYAEDGGTAKDGVIELRRGVPDISLNKAKYAQVRIAVGDPETAATNPNGTHYLKGMAMYGDNMPKGVDIIFNTNKKTGTPMLGESSDNTVLKQMKNDPENPFGASIKYKDSQLIRAQRHYIDENGNKQLSSLNIVNEEGDWSSWSKNLASQMLSKQSPALAKRQLDLAHDIAKEEFDEIMTLTNPTVKASLLDKFADQCDSDATHMKAAPLPGQASKVLLPVPEMNESEIYAPHLSDGTQVALVRYPHGGIFEIPTLTVNNKNKSAKAVMENAMDAVGIHPKVAERLSGADFDGDTAIVIPIDNVKIKTAPPLEGLKNFDAKALYKLPESAPKMTPHEKGIEMGKVSNLITDMTIKGATSKEICLAVRHSMVVIDAEKHHLDYKRSEVDHHIAELKAKYQAKPNGEPGGASTLLSRATSEIQVDQRREKAVSKMTPDELAAWKEGKVIWETTGQKYTKKKILKSGVVKYEEKNRKESTTRMMETDDAYSLVSGSKDNTTRIETVYADFANSMKALANAARKESRLDEDIPYDPHARTVYAKEYNSLNGKLKNALRNAPLERQAQLIANKIVATKRYNNPDMDADHLKRMKGIELQNARDRVGAKKDSIWIDDKEWEAINAGAVHKSFLKDILKNADPVRVRELATPRASKGMSTGKISMAKSMLSRGHTQSDVAEALGVSVSTLLRAIGKDQF